MSISDATTTYTEPVQAKPASGGTYWDATFGTKVRRLQDRAGYSNYLVPVYSEIQAWNADQTKILFVDDGDNGHIFTWNATTYLTHLKAMGGNAACLAPRWSPTDPALLYYFKSSDNRLYSWNFTTSTEQTIWTFAGYASFPKDQNAQEISNDGRYMGVCAVTSGGAYHAFVVDLNSPANPTSTLTLTNGSNTQWVMASPLGGYVLVMSGQTGLSGIYAYNRADMSYAGKVTGCAGHGDVTVDSDGYEYAVWDDSSVTTAQLKKSRVPNGYATSTVLLVYDALNTGKMNTHTSARNILNHGERNNYVVVSFDTQQNPSVIGLFPFQNEIIKLYLDSTQAVPHVERLAHSHTQQFPIGVDGIWLRPCPLDYYYPHSIYWAAPHATVSPDGQYIVFGSNWKENSQMTIPHVYNSEPELEDMDANPWSNPYVLHCGEWNGTPTYAQMPDNLWVKLTTTQPGYTGLPARSYSGGAWDSFGDRFYYYGGGHDSYCGNEMQVFDPDTLVWSTPYVANFADPVNQAALHQALYHTGNIPEDDEGPVQDVHNYGPYADGYPRYPASPRPWMPHTYQNQACDAAGNMIHIDSCRRTWKYTVAGDWVLLAPANQLPANGTCFYPGKTPVVYCSVTGEFITYIYRGTADDGTYAYTIAGNTWTRLGTYTNVPTCGSMHVSMAYDPVADCIYLFGGEDYTTDIRTWDETWVFDVQAHTWDKKTPVLSPMKRSGHGSVFDTKNGVFIIWGGSYYYPGESHIHLTDMWAYNPRQTAEGNWHQVIQPATIPTVVYSYDYDNRNVYGSFVYDPSRNLMLAVYCANGSGSADGATYYNAETWVYRYRTDGQGGAPTPPSGVLIMRMMVA